MRKSYLSLLVKRLMLKHVLGAEKQHCLLRSLQYLHVTGLADVKAFVFYHIQM